MPPGRRAARRTGRRAARRTTRRRAVGPGGAPASRGRRRRRALVTLLAVGGTAAVAYKIGRNNAQKIEQYTGKPLDDLSEEELSAAMDDLNIDLPEEEGQADAQVEDDYYEEDDYVDEPDYIDELERLAALKEKGIISQEEFDAKKKQLLGL